MSFYKIGYQLAFAGGLAFAETLIRAGKKVFLDLKLHDIGNTVAKGVESVAKLGATFLTVHAYPQTMHAAVEARKGSGLRILAVTVLTSYDDADLAAAGYDLGVRELVAERAAQARDIGVDGLVCSAEEAARLRTDRRRRHGAGDAGHPAGWRRQGRPEAHHDAGRRRSRPAPIIWWSAGRSSKRPIRKPRLRRLSPRSPARRVRGQAQCRRPTGFRISTSTT